MNIKKKFFYNYFNLIQDNIIDFIFLVFLLTLEVLIITSSVLTIIPISDFILNTNQEQFNTITKYFVKILKIISFDASLRNVIFLFFIIEFSKIVISFFIAKKILDLRFKLHLRLFKNIFRNTLNSNNDFFEKFDGGILLSTFTIIIKNISSSFATIAMQIAQIIKLVALISIPLFLNAKLVIINFLIFAIVFFPMKIITKMSYKLGKKITFYRNTFTKNIYECLQSIKLIFVFNNQEKQISNTYNDLTKVNISEKKNMLLDALVLNSYRPLGIISAGIAFIIYYENYYVGEEISKTVAVFWSLLSAAPVLGNIINNNMSVVNLLPGLEQYNKLLNESKKYSLKKNSSIKKTKPFNFKNSIIFKNVTFNYEKKYDLIKNKSFKIIKNQTTLIHGSSGSGKSTLIDLILGFKKPKSGSILVDNVSLNKINQNKFFSILGYVPQDPFLFNASIKDNLVWVKDDSTLEEINEALKLSLSYDFVKKFKKGLNTNVGDRGLKLSGGQRQRIALARVLMLKPKILILDEATNSLDKKSKKIINEVLNNLKGKKTIIIVDHDVSDDLHYDKKIII